MAQDDSRKKLEQQPVVETPPVVEVVGGGEVVEVVRTSESTKEVEKSRSLEVEKRDASTQLEDQPIVEPVTPKIAPVQSIAPKKSKFEAEIEEVLQEDLTDLYLSMTPEDRKAFRVKGEETVTLIHQLVRAAHMNTKKIFQLIRTWLQMIPGVNRFFLEQEAKIKTDKVLLVAEEEKRRGSKDLL